MPAVLDAGAISYGVGAGAFLVLTVLLLTAWRGRLQGGLLLTACAVSVAWGGAAALYALGRTVPYAALELTENLRAIAWFGFLLNLLGFMRRDGGRRSWALWLAGIAGLGTAAGLIVFILSRPYLVGPVLHASSGRSILIVGHVMLAILGLLFIEQLARNTRPERRWTIKFLCFGVGGIFAYDLFLYSDALLFNHISSQLWAARGAINALAVPLIAVSAARNPDWSLEIFVSRHVVFHSATILGAGGYLVLMAGAGYYIRAYGGSWGAAAQIVFLFGAAILLLLLVSSGQLRARARVFLSKHFFRNKYDYREEWLRFTRTLSSAARDVSVNETVIRAVSEIVESPAGAMWVRDHHGGYFPAAGWNTQVPAAAGLSENDSLTRFLLARQWVIFLDGYHADAGSYPGLTLPAWLEALEPAWVIIPLMQRDELLGFVVAYRSTTKFHLNWEDSDLLKTVGRQAASYIALVDANEALLQSRQFEAFNRLSAYVVHDLKNLVAQLSLVSSNARKHMHNPEFVKDAVETVENATEKMNRLLAQLRKDRLEDTSSRLVNLKPIVLKVIEARSSTRPEPIAARMDDGAIVAADPDRVAAILEHLVQNAQEATPDGGSVTISAYRDAGEAIVEVADSGSGMDARFISERLFRPFDTTKGNAGMGIGVYEAREFVQSRGGRMQVESEPGRGTLFRLRFPLAGEAEPPVCQKSAAGLAG